MKKLVVLGALMFSLNGYANESLPTLMTCEKSGVGFTIITFNKGFEAISRLNFNYSSATLVCPQYIESRVQNKKEFQCAGLWDFDFDPDNMYKDGPDSVAKVEVKPVSGQKWEARFITNMAYGSLPVTVSCEEVSE